MSALSPVRRTGPPLAAAATVTVVVLLMASAMAIGADTKWLVAMGDVILDRGSLPMGIPFAEADSSGWANVPVLAEVALALVDRLGPLGLPGIQLAIDTALLCLLFVGGRRDGAGDRAIAVILLVSSFGMLPALGVIRAQAFSLIPFAALLLLLRDQQRRPTGRIWLVVPLIAVWGNLHGAVLVGVAMTFCYLVFARIRTDAGTAIGVGFGTLVALFANPAHVRTVSYYVGVLGNEAARRGTELWARPQLDKPFDLLLIAAGCILMALALARRRPVWEYVAIVGLAVATISAARHGVWLLLLLTAPAASGLTSIVSRSSSRRIGDPTDVRPGPGLAFVALVMVVGLGILVPRSASFRTDPELLHTIRSAAQGRTVLATEPLAESLAADGMRLWLSNPIDAFSRADQAAYLDFSAGGGPSAGTALEAADVVVAPTGSPSAALAVARGFVLDQRVRGTDVLRRP